MLHVANLFELSRKDITEAGTLATLVWHEVFELIDADPGYTGDDAGEIAEAASRAAKRAILDVLSRC